MVRPKIFGHAESLPWREKVDAALDAIVAGAPSEIRDQVEYEVAEEARYWAERARSRDDSARITVEIPRPIRELESVAPPAAPMCGGHCGELLPSKHYAGVPTAAGEVNLCPACHAERFAVTRGNGA